MNSRSAAILFLSHDSPEWAALAAVAARRYVESPGRVVAACRNGQAVDKVFASVAREDGLFLPGTVESFSESDAFGFDLVICLHGGGNLVVPPFPGVPATISWDLSDLARLEEMDVLSVLRARQSRIIQMVDDLFEQGYLECILQSRANAGLILENLYDGVIAHDLSRRIFYFNRAAEEIAGIRRDEVIGRDCHEVFAERLCGEYCSFCAGCAHFPNAPIRYPVSFRSKTGESRRVEITVVPLKDPMGRPFGVVATLKDVTRESELIRRVGDVDEFHGIVGHEPSIRHVIRIIKDVADTDLPILIQGESGTGKELVAAAIHDLSRRNKRLLVPVNCGGFA